MMMISRIMMIHTLQLYVSDLFVPNDFYDSKSTAEAKPGMQREEELKLERGFHKWKAFKIGSVLFFQLPS